VSPAADGSTRARIVIADDHSVVRTGLRLLVERSGWEVAAEAGDVPETLAQVARHRPDVLLLDLHMPGGSIEDAIREVAATGVTRVLVLSADEHPGSVRAALRAGATGYVPKDASPHELIDAVGLVAHGDAYVSPRLGALLASAPADRLGRMPADDVEVLRLLALGHTSREIADMLDSSQQQVEWQRKRLQRALGVHGRAELVRIALDEGLIEADGATP
jgi:two-component system, NarL family, response regulator NreC